MNLEEIKELMGVMRKQKMKEVEVEQKGVRVRIVAMPSSRSAQISEAANMQRMVGGPYVIASTLEPGALPAPQATHSAPAPSAMSPADSAAKATEAAIEAEERGVEIKSPMVGTFYRAPAPDAPSYVEPGSVVNKDTVLCIIEAMKLMNEIKAESRGKILRVLAENGQPVEFNQPLFLMEAF